MLVKEYRIVMPLTLEEYKIGQLYAVSQSSLNETGGGEGVEVVSNEPFVDTPLFDGQHSEGQFTLKKYHLASRVPTFLRWIAPKGSLEVEEHAWNAFPYCRTIISNPAYMKEDFSVKIETIHVDNDRGELENAHHLTPELLEAREVVHIDIAADPSPASDYRVETDPTRFRSRTGRGPLDPGTWISTCSPVMTSYKLVTIEFKWTGLQSRMERFIHRQEKRVLTNFHRQLFCWMDVWADMTLDDIRVLEERIREELVQARATGRIVGTSLDGDPNSEPID